MKSSLLKSTKVNIPTRIAFAMTTKHEDEESEHDCDDLLECHFLFEAKLSVRGGADALRVCGPTAKTTSTTVQYKQSRARISTS